MIRCWIACSVCFTAGSLAAQDLATQDLAYGLVIHNRIASANTVLPESEVTPVLGSVFENLVNTPLVQDQGGSQSLFYLRNAGINAFAGAGGRLYVTDLLVGTLDANPGTLAFVLGHELAHNVLRHGLLKYLRAVERERQIGYLQWQAAHGDKSANWVLIGYVAADKIASAKIARDEENAADRLGLFIAAQAGYHPDFGIAAARILRQKLGEHSKFGAFFSDHPRWTTREERAETTRTAALAVFNSRWQSAADSRGGVPPTILSANEPAIKHQGKSYQIDGSFSVRNLRSGAASIRLVAFDEHGDGSIIATRAAVADDSGLLSVELPDTFFKGKRGHQWVKLAVQETGMGAVESSAKKIK